MKKIILYLLFFLLLQHVVLLLTGVAFAILQGAPLEFTIQGIAKIMTTVDVISYGLLFFNVLIILIFGFSGWTKVDLNKVAQGGVPVIIASVLFVLSGATVMNIITSYLEIENNLADLFISIAHTVPGFLTVSLLAPIAEEMLFRGAIQRTLCDKGYHAWSAIGISSLLFGLIHGNPAQIPFAIVLGVMFGWIYYRTNSLVPVILGHIANNTIACLLIVGLPDESQFLNTLDIHTWAVITLAVSLIAIVALAFFLNKKMGEIVK